MKLFTIQMSKWREARNREILFIDTTVKSGDALFAPTWDMVMGHKQGTMSDEEYTQRYRQMMIQSWIHNRPRWEQLLRSDEQVAIACYCPPGKFCHRHLLKGIFQELSGQLGVPFEYYGELS